MGVLFSPPPLFLVGTVAIFSSTSSPALSWPKAVYWRSRNFASPWQMKNWQPALSGCCARAMEITPRWWLGGQTGFFYWGKSYANASSSQWFIPIVPTLLYNFNSVSASFHPYAGIGLGVAYIHTNFSPIGGLDATDSSVKLETLLHLGAKFGRKRRFFADLGLGLINDSFALAPQVGWIFSF